MLIVEDDEEIRSLLYDAFTNEGFAVDTAPDGKRGSTCIQSTEYDIILLDNCLPYKTGKELCTEMRLAGNHTPVLLLSVVDECAAKVELLNCGADDYVTKPYMFKELLARVHVLLRRPRQVVGPVFYAQEIVLDIARHLVMVEEEKIELTPKEFSILAYLMRNKDITVTRMSLLEHVWGVDADPFSNTVETHILNLRKKIGQYSSAEIIRTISGVGYQVCS